MAVDDDEGYLSSTLPGDLRSVMFLSKILLFWIAFILTRPFGATFGDLLTKTADQGGLDFGRGYASLILLALLLVTLFAQKYTIDGKSNI